MWFYKPSRDNRYPRWSRRPSFTRSQWTGLTMKSFLFHQTPTSYLLFLHLTIFFKWHQPEIGLPLLPRHPSKIRPSTSLVRPYTLLNDVPFRTNSHWINHTSIPLSVPTTGSKIGPVYSLGTTVSDYTSSSLLLVHPSLYYLIKSKLIILKIHENLVCLSQQIFRRVLSFDPNSLSISSGISSIHRSRSLTQITLLPEPDLGFHVVQSLYSLGISSDSSSLSSLHPSYLSQATVPLVPFFERVPCPTVTVYYDVQAHSTPTSSQITKIIVRPPTTMPTVPEDTSLLQSSTNVTQLLTQRQPLHLYFPRLCNIKTCKPTRPLLSGLRTHLPPKPTTNFLL